MPSMSIDHTEESIVYYINYYKISCVSYIDFIPINKKPGFGENVLDFVKSAFIHFSHPWLCSDYVYRYQSITPMKNIEFWETITIGKPYGLETRPNDYWICLKIVILFNEE